VFLDSGELHPFGPDTDDSRRTLGTSLVVRTKQMIPTFSFLVGPAEGALGARLRGHDGKRVGTKCQNRTTRDTPMSDTFSKVEVITGVARRRRFSTDLKLAVVAETMQPGMSVSYVARRRHQLLAIAQMVPAGTSDPTRFKRLAGAPKVSFVPLLVTYRLWPETIPLVNAVARSQRSY
jgi:hypothetical protein